jgi:hypothetical protein
MVGGGRITTHVWNVPPIVRFVRMTMLMTSQNVWSAKKDTTILWTKNVNIVLDIVHLAWETGTAPLVMRVTVRKQKTKLDASRAQADVNIVWTAVLLPVMIVLMATTSACLTMTLVDASHVVLSVLIAYLEPHATNAQEDTHGPELLAQAALIIVMPTNVILIPDAMVALMTTSCLQTDNNAEVVITAPIVQPQPLATFVMMVTS